MNKEIIKYGLLWLIGLLVNNISAFAQLNPLATSYFQNQYLNNPALAGIDRDVQVNLSYRKQWSSIPGAPATQIMTGTYGFTDRAGLGLSVIAEQAGLQKWTNVSGSYAYHLPLDIESRQLHFGVSLGFANERLNENAIEADPNDIDIVRYNQRRTYLDGTFGVAYTSKGLSLQASVPNLKSFFNTDDNNQVDRAVFFSSASYRFNIEVDEQLSFEPKVCFRGVKGYKNIFDAGANIGLLSDQIQFFGMYHSTQSASYGLNFRYRTVAIGGMFTSQTSALSKYTDGSFEVTMRLNLL